MSGRDEDRPVSMSEERDIELLPDQTLDDMDHGWGDRLAADQHERAAEERLMADRPPHWDR